MSKNFELLMEIDKEFDSAPPEPDHRQESAALRAPSSDTLSLSGSDDEVTPLVQRVFLSVNGSAHRQVVFCGVEAANPSSSVCARAARSLATRTHERVCLVSAKGSGAGAMRQYGIPAELDGNGSTTEQYLPIAGNLWITQCKGINGGGEQALAELRARFTELQREFGYILIDAPGCIVSDEATVLGQASDAVILVIEAQSTQRHAAIAAKRKLEAAGIRLAGTVLNNRPLPIPTAIYRRL